MLEEKVRYQFFNLLCCPGARIRGDPGACTKAGHILLLPSFYVHFVQKHPKA